MSSSPWKIQLKFTGLNEKRQMDEQNATKKLLGRQEELVAQNSSNTYKQQVFGTRQDNLAADAMAGQQDRLYGIQQKRINESKDNDDDAAAYPEEGRSAIFERPYYLKGGRKRKTRRRKRKLSRRKKRQTRK
jgi:hypothetical protein